MTIQIKLSLDLNANDIDALRTLVDHPEAVAAAAALHDPRLQARIIGVLAEIKSQLTEY
ncbi:MULTISPECIES: hypothetical protein [Pseudomonas]|uniref:Uncharacterized protein n=1 Tax=Pseudomonas segetis TaxID=298908 RepID=A0A239JAY7_9PSED|nr:MULTISPECIES: hypothetical protein [Pseudomonas]UUY09001.1 hypothetical protein LRS11_02920 [Pseudomonas sp. J452]SNT03176.1 hypothetical protein SAMN05216255_4270 [Pseudomonas segetis]